MSASDRAKLNQKITPTRRFAATSPLKGEVEGNHPSGDRT
jgi:hypothetical protein